MEYDQKKKYTLWFLLQTLTFIYYIFNYTHGGKISSCEQVNDAVNKKLQFGTKFPNYHPETRVSYTTHVSY